MLFNIKPDLVKHCLTRTRALIGSALEILDGRIPSEHYNASSALLKSSSFMNRLANFIDVKCKFMWTKILDIRKLQQKSSLSIDAKQLEEFYCNELLAFSKLCIKYLDWFYIHRNVTDSGSSKHILGV
jgi:hypothetical protein